MLESSKTLLMEILKTLSDIEKGFVSNKDSDRNIISKKKKKKIRYLLLSKYVDLVQ